MGWFAKLFPAPAILTKLVIYVLVFALGGAVGNYQATKRALERELQASADRQRENHLVLFEEFKRRNAEYKKHIEQQQDADAAAYAVLSQGKADADRAAKQARASLRIALGEKQKLEQANDGLRNVSEMLAAEARRPDPPCQLGPELLNPLNDFVARLNRSPNVGNTPADATAVPVGSAGADTPLACSDLADSVIDILQVAGGYIARDASWREWAGKQ